MLSVFIQKKFLNFCPGVLRLPANIYIVKSKSPSPDGLLNYPDRNVSYIKLATLSLSPLYITLQTKSLVGYEIETTGRKGETVSVIRGNGLYSLDLLLENRNPTWNIYSDFM